MKTQLTEQELNFYNDLCGNKKEHEERNSEYCFLNKLYYSNNIKDKPINEIDFCFDINNKKIFLEDSILLFEAIDSIYVGKINDFFWFMDEYENIYLISKNMGDILNTLLFFNSSLRLDNLETFYYINQIQMEHIDFKDYLEEYKLFSKQYGYDFDLMKDIDDYEGIEKDVEEFNKLLSSYGIVNEEE